MNWRRAACAAALGLLALAGCTHGASETPAAEAVPQSVLLIGLYGPNPALLKNWDAPSLNALAAGGVQAAAMYPVMPSLTFVNFYSLATGS